MNQPIELPIEAPEDIVAAALQALDIEIGHSAASLQETRYWLAHDGVDDPTLVDLTALPFITMDNPDSQDLDQALLISRYANDCYRVRYALADAAYYIRPGSALFDEALARGSTYYTPLLSAPMLPRELSEGLVSLNPSVDRRALVFDMIVDERAIVTRTSVVRARIHSHAKLDYGSVQHWLDSESSPLQPWDESLLLLRELGSKLIEAGAARGVVPFDRTETLITIDGQPPRFEASLRKRYHTERYNEQISLICNMQGAEMLLALSGVTDALQAVYRVHEAPLKKSLAQLRHTLENFAAEQEHPLRWRWIDGQPLADYVEQLPAEPEHRRRVMAVQRQIMQAQRASSFTLEAGEHHALKAASYARLSSPMREVVGIFTHKELLEALSGHSFDNESDTVLRDAVIESANQSRQRQRALEKKIEFAAIHSVFARELAQAEPPPHSGTVLGFRGDRLYIRLDDMAVDVKLYREDLEARYGTRYAMSDTKAMAQDAQSPDWHLGQAIQLTISGYDRERKRFLFDPGPV